MPRITIKVGEPLRQILGQRRVSQELPQDATAADLLAVLAQCYPGFQEAFRGEEAGRAAPYIFFLNHRPVTPPHFDHTHLRDGDVVHLVLPVVGGAHG